MFQTVGQGTALLGIMLLTFAPVAPLRAQTQTTQPVTTAPAQSVGQNPLVTETKENGTTLWELVIPRNPGAKSRLTDGQVLLGLRLIDEKSEEEKKKFLDEYASKVQPGPESRSVAEDLIIATTNGEVLKLKAEEIRPNQVTIAKTSEEIKKYFGLNPESFVRSLEAEDCRTAKAKDPNVFCPIVWGRDPMGPNRVAQKTDILKNLEVVEKKIRQIESSVPEQAEAWIRAMKACIEQSTSSETCYEATDEEIPFLQRNHGASSVGTNERRLQGTPIYKMLVYWVPETQVWRGNGYECEGNPLEFFQFADARSLRTEAVARIPGMPAQVECVSITPSTNAKTNAQGEIEITPGSAGISFTAEVKGDTAVGIEAKRELWTVNGVPKSGNQSFEFLPTLVDFKTGRYEVVFQFTDQFQRTSVCPARIVNIVTPDPPPLITRTLPPVTTAQAPPAKAEPPKKGSPKWPWLLLAAGALVPLLFLSGDKAQKGAQSGVVNPGPTPNPRLTASGGVTFSWGGRK